MLTVFQTCTSAPVQVIFITTDTFLGPAGTAIEDRLVENAVARVRGGGNHLAIQLRVKDAGKVFYFVLFCRRTRPNGRNTNK